MFNTGYKTFARQTLSLFCLLSILAVPAYPQDDRSQIERIVFLIQQGVQKSSSDIVFSFFRADSLQNQNDVVTDKQSTKQGVDALLVNFSNRVLPTGMDGLTTTADFRLQVKAVTFFEEGRRANVEILAGFAALPPDSSLFIAKSAVEKGAMTDQEKLITMNFRPVSLQFMKVDGTWYVSSFGNFNSVLTAINQAYPGGALPEKNRKRKE